MRMPGRVYLVGAGPGDPELLTLKALRLLRQAETLVYDRLVADDILSLANPAAIRIPVGKQPRHHPVPQEEINAILVAQAMAGRMTVRLKGGDPFIFGRGCEEALALREAGFGCEIVPGITAAQGCAASAGIPLTHRGLATSVRLVTGHCRQDAPLDFDWRGLADPKTTLVVYMGVANISEIAGRLIEEGLSAATPLMAISNGTMPSERRLVSDLEHVTDDLAAARFSGPVLFIIGAVVSAQTTGHVCPLVRQAVSLGLTLQEAPAHA